MSQSPWRNWAGNQSCSPASVVTPGSLRELAATVAAATDAGQQVKPIGAGHSFTAIGLTNGTQLRLDALAGLTHVDAGRGLVTVRAGTRLFDLNLALARNGLALENLGDIDRQTISGALATGTHGTGARFGGLAAQVHALTLVTADGSVLVCDAQRNPEVFAAARVGLGALGVVADVTLRCVSAFRLRAVERPGRLAETLETFAQTAAEHDHAEFYWFPHTDRVQTKVNDRTGDDEPLSRLRYLVDDELLSNGLFEVVNQLGRFQPRTIPAINQVAARGLTARSYTAPSYEVFTSPRRVRFTESEYAIPRDALSAALGALRSWVDSHDERIAIPVEVRVAASDDSWLSTGYDRENAYIAVHQFHRRDHRPYFSAFEAIAAEHSGRPHWGKLHTLGAARLAELYPRLGDFAALRDRLDPTRTFDNDYLRHVLG